MKVQILGGGCAKCTTLYRLAETVAREQGLDVELEKVTDLRAIVAMGVMLTPALAVDGVVKCAGKVPSRAEVAAALGVG